MTRKEIAVAVLPGLTIANEITQNVAKIKGGTPKTYSPKQQVTVAYIYADEIIKQEDDDSSVCALVAKLDSMTDEERLKVMDEYCPHCAGPAGCQCWNDE